jgi:hypothetical protein
MKSFLNLLSLFILLTFPQIIAQGEAALPFLYLNPSPQSTGLGWTGVSNANDDAFGFHYNPAILGYSSQHNNISMQTYPGSIDWMNFGGLDINSSAFNVGYNFKKELNGFNLSAGVGYMHSRFSFGTFVGTSDFYESYDSFDAYAFGVSMNYYVMLAIGITYKNIYSQLGESPISSVVNLKPAEANAIDYGILLTLPVTDLFDNRKIKLPYNSMLIPEFNYTLGYSRLNIGDGIYYIDPAQTDPLPLTARLGQTLNFGIDYKSEDISINMIDYNLIIEADDILIKREYKNDIVNTTYQGMLGDIDLGKHLIQLKSDDKVVVHKGHAIKLVETITILKGSFTGRGYNRIVQTDGLILSSSGLFKWLGSITENETLKFIANHIEFKYINSTIFDREPIETDFSGVSISFLNYSFN